MKSLLKKLTSSMLVLIGRISSKKNIPILLYHSVDNSDSVISIKPEEFELQMQYLSDSQYQAITLSEYVQHLDTDKEKPKKKVVITFDDGFKNNYSEAFPILKKHGFTATIFLATSFMGGVCTWVRHSSIPEIPLLSWEEVQEMSKGGIDFESHGTNHSFFSSLSREDMKKELLESKAVIEKKINRKVIFFCHPYGDITKETQQLAQECGYAGAFGINDYSLSNRTDDIYEMGRVGTRRFTSLQDFKAGLLGSYDWYIRFRKTLAR